MRNPGRVRLSCVIDRRSALRTLASAALAAVGGAACRDGKVTEKPMNKPLSSTNRQPVVFLAHGAPPLLDDQAWLGELAAWAQAMPKPRALLVVSAHWEARPPTLGATKTVPLVYDFYGFPERYYQVTYPAPGAPELASRVRGLLGGVGLGSADDPERGLDHGAFVPLLAMYPDHDVPTLQLSLPSLDAKEIFAMGTALAPLRDEGVLVMGSGFLTHNMRSLGERSTPAWAKDFDGWAAEVLAKKNVDALLDWKSKAPGAAQSHPRSEHLAPVFAAAGAAVEGGDVTFPITGYWNLAPAFTRRSVQIG